MRAWRRPPFWTWPLLFAPVLTVGYHMMLWTVGPTAVVMQVVYSTSTAIAVVGLIAAAARHGRTGRGPWLALAAGQAAMVVRDLTYFAMSRACVVVSYPGPPDVFTCSDTWAWPGDCCGWSGGVHRAGTCPARSMRWWSLSVWGWWDGCT